MEQSRTLAAHGRRSAELDGLRCLAVFGVLYQHWFSPWLPLGSWGVILFFVISGYVISRSLMSFRDKRVSLGAAARIFFINRARRLLPAYFLVLLVAMALLPGMSDRWPWYVFFGSDFLPV